MAEPVEWIAIAEGVALAGEALGVFGGVAEVAAGVTAVAETALIAASAVGASSVLALDAVGGAALGVSTATEAAMGTG